MTFFYVVELIMIQLIPIKNTDSIVSYKWVDFLGIEAQVQIYKLYACRSNLNLSLKLDSIPTLELWLVNKIS